MRFTKYQYEQAIRRLQEGMTQLEPDGNECACCGDSGHQAWQCHHNPLRAMWHCDQAHKFAGELHEQLHAMIGANYQGPGLLAALPARSPEEEYGYKPELAAAE